MVKNVSEGHNILMPPVPSPPSPLRTLLTLDELVGSAVCRNLTQNADVCRQSLKQ